jgi:CubicO group peptidase (beta-lactamase class C family)
MLSALPTARLGLVGVAVLLALNCKARATGPATPCTTVSAHAAQPATQIVIDDARLFDGSPDPSAELERKMDVSDISPVALLALVSAAEQSASDSLVVIKDGRIVVERYFGRVRQPMQLRSITKVFTGLAIGLLVAEGKLSTIDVPISNWFPEWNDGLRAKVLVRHLLDHTSGIEHQVGDKELYAESDSIRYVRSHKVVDVPGSKYSYNNDAVQLLSEIIKTVSGEDEDLYLKRRLFDKLHIRDYSWSRDATGHVHAYSGLALNALQLATFGQLLLDGGVWHKEQVLPRAWLDQATKPAASAQYGLLWELYARPSVVLSSSRLGEMAAMGFPFAAQLQPIVDKPFASSHRLWMEMAQVLDPTNRDALALAIQAGVPTFERSSGEQIGFGHSGSFGQCLFVVPARNIVVVRQRRGDGTGNDVDLASIIAAL